jgi:hypothetical protein
MLLVQGLPWAGQGLLAQSVLRFYGLSNMSLRVDVFVRWKGSRFQRSWRSERAMV